MRTIGRSGPLILVTTRPVVLLGREEKVKKVSVGTYKKDTLYPKVVRATARILKTSDEISPVAVFLQMGNLDAKAHDA